MADSKIALFIGGAGNIGSSAITAFLQHGGYKHVIMISRTQERVDKAIEHIREKVGQSADKIIGIVGCISDAQGALDLKAKVTAKVGDKIDTVISVVGFPYLNYGPVLEMKFEQFEFAFKAQFFTAFGAYRTFMPLVKNSSCGSYVFVTGGGPETYIGPGTGVMTISGTGNNALAKVALKEHAQDNVACTELSLQLGVYPDPSMGQPGLPSITSLDAGKGLLSIATKRVADGKTLIIRAPDDIQKVILNGCL